MIKKIVVWVVPGICLFLVFHWGLDRGLKTGRQQGQNCAVPFNRFIPKESYEDSPYDLTQHKRKLGGFSAYEIDSDSNESGMLYQVQFPYPILIEAEKYIKIEPYFVGVEDEDTE